MPSHKATSKDYFLESGLKEIQLLRKHFHIDGTGDDVKIIGEIVPADVTNFYKEYFTRVRPQQLGFDKTLPEPNSKKLRALYMGDSDANVLLNVVVRHVLYVDQILVVDPFLTVILEPAHPKSVLNRPEIWVSELVNRALCLCALEDWVRQGVIVLIPNLFYYHPELLRIPTSLRITPNQRRAFELTTIRDLLLGERPENRNALLDFLVEMGRTTSDDERARLLEEAEQYERENPIRFRLAPGYFDKYFSESQQRGEVRGRGNGGLPLIHASELAERTGSFLIFEHQYLYKMLCSNVSQTNEKTNSLQQLSLAFQNLAFPFLHDVSSKKALELRNQGYLLSFRNYLRDLWPSIATMSGPQLDSRIADFCDRLTSEYVQLEKEWEHIRKDLRISAAVTGAVTGLTVIASGTIVMAVAAPITAGLGLAGYQQIKDLRQVNQKPLAVFLKLAH